MEERDQPRSEAAAFGEEAAGDFDLRKILEILGRRWRVGILLAIVCVLGSLVQYSLTPKRYRASSLIQIERPIPPLASDQMGWLAAWWSLDFYPTQFRLLESRGLAERVVRKLRLHEDPVFNPGWKPKREGEEAELGDKQLAKLAKRLLRDLDVSAVKDTQLFTISYVASTAELASDVANAMAATFIEWRVETSRTSVGKASDFLAEQVESLKEQIRAKELEIQALREETDMLAEDPASNMTSEQLSRLTSAYVAKVSERIEKEVRYRELLETPAERVAESLSTPVLDELRQEKLRLEREYSDKLEVFKPEWPEMIEIQERIDQLEEQLSRVAREEVVRARNEARIQYEASLGEEGALATRLKQSKADVMALNSTVIEYNSLKNELDTQSKLLSDMLRRRSEADIAIRLEGNAESSVRVVDRAVPPDGPFQPSLQKALLTGSGLGLAVGLGAMFLLEFLDRSIKTGAEAEKRLGLPVLAEIPDVLARQLRYGGRYGYRYGYGYGYGRYGYRLFRRVPAGNPAARERPVGKKELARPIIIELLPLEKPRHVVSEAYRSLRTAVLLSSAEELKTVAITSAHSGEGKTTSAANLAIVMAQLGRRVLLIDADLRKPRLHELLEVSNRTGLVGYLTQGREVKSVIKPTRATGLELIPSGPIPPNPSELLASARMQELLALARRHYDFVILDTPPVLAVSDPVIIGALVDRMILCIRAGVISRDHAQQCVDRLEMGGVRLLGILLNGHRPGAGSDEKKYYYYYHAYGGDQEKDSSAGSAA